MSRNYRRIPRATVAGEEELGPQKLCVLCGEWYPPDLEFFPAVHGRLNSYCRACSSERRMALLRRRAVAA